CSLTGRYSDRAGIDAVLRVKERFGPQSVLTNFTIEVQLKATIHAGALRDGSYSFPLRVEHYEKLRDEGHATPLLLVVLFLPERPEEWLVHSEKRLIAHRCAYWTSLRGAPPTENAEKQTVYIPKENCLSVEGLRALAERISRGEVLTYGV
ncbi:MAG TPA: DUF4365 domain-containing protein, partial [Thermoanaerobaculia bacterium]|nr:DUF4365 domain-containing protein [Thermoanaerobaculia bacterium]